MVEIGKWLLLGGTVGFVLQWVLDSRALLNLKQTLPDPEETDRLKQENNRLSLQVQSLQSKTTELEAAQSEVRTLQKTVAALQSQTPPSPASQTSTPDTQPQDPTPASLHQLDSLTPDQIEQLQKAGIDTLEELAQKSSEEILEALDAQPWDMVDPEPWLQQAKTLLAAQPAVQTQAQNTVTEIAEAAQDLTQIEGILPEHAEKLLASGIQTFTQLAQKTEDEILEIIEAQPWDMVDVASWITQAEELA